MSAREKILSRILAVLEAAGTGGKVVRNAVDYTASMCPIVALLDGDEEAHEDTQAFGHGRFPNAPTLMAMRPEIWLLVEGNPATVGPALNGLRDVVLSALSNDAQLIGLVHNKDIRYEGCTTALGAGRTLTGEMNLHLRFVYTHRT
jgi:hypothetical protein